MFYSDKNSVLDLLYERSSENSISPIFIAIKTKMKSLLRCSRYGGAWGLEKNLCTIIIIANGHLGVAL